MNDLFAASSWIWLLDKRYQEAGRRVLFRKRFTLEKVTPEMPVRISADSRYLLTVNGHFVHYGPTRSAYDGTWPYDEINLAEYLLPGENIIAVRVVHLTANVFAQPAAACGGLLLALPAAGVYSNDSFKALAPAAFDPPLVKTSPQYVYQETVNLNRMPMAWTKLDFDDSSWQQPDYLRCAEAEPYGQLIPRDIPLLKGFLLNAELQAITTWHSAPDWQEISDPVELYCHEKADWMAPDPTGNVKGLLFDFDCTKNGTVLCEYEGASGNETVDLLYTEAIDGSGQPVFIDPAGPGSSISMASRLRLAPGSGSHELDMPMGFRYAVAVLRNAQENLQVRVRLRNCSYDLQITGAFETSDPLINQIWQMAVNTQLACSSDTYIDCPWREQAQWWGDARIQALNTFALSDDCRLLRRGIRQIGATRTVSGLTRAFAPAMPWNTVIPDFSLNWIMTIYDDFFQTGTLTLFREQKKRMAEVIDSFTARRSTDGMLRLDKRYWNFFDWGYPPVQGGLSILENLMYLHALDKMVELAQQDQQSDGCHERLAMEMRTVMKTYFLSDNGASALQEPRTAAYAILTDILTPAACLQAEKILLAEIQSEKPIGASPYFIHYLFVALKMLGRHQEIIDCIRHRWGYWLQIGIHTTPESWATPENFGRTSLCHAWSSHILAHFRDLILGVTQIAPGWRKIRFQPLLKTCKWVRGTIPTPLGSIHVDLSNDQENLDDIRILLPPGIECQRIDRPSNHPSKYK